MIENPIIQSLILISWGFLIGVLATIYWLSHQARGVLSDIWKALASFGLKTKETKNVTFKQFWSAVSKVVNNTFEELEDEEAETSFKDRISHK